jgi:hypothetical protein
MSYLLTITLPAPHGVTLTARVLLHVAPGADVAPLAAAELAAAGPGAELVGVEVLRFSRREHELC